ncbi:PREDICTED: uncharacterized protein LOC109583588 [Amphimedon queenslandica]|uniref:Death domain-containing protein n=1 Tax=Amphimedon queenslandica TaxID=400682 RepID=A0AAN0JCQ8_AMPQE|nr:PREDICTED: uncharacterized protein LOC109583588 [Amphimedon queenslandica]|eukprot:XP_019854562.1 PREDICTED: uncharacterized protein LOC109583588 [Amphimedon queenslandica]
MATRSSQNCLGIDNLVDVLDLLKRCGFPETKWHELGLRLGLRKNTLDAIEMKYHGDLYRCMTECLSQWLGRADNVDSRGGANLDSLSDVLRFMNESAVAEKLSESTIASLCDSVSIAWLLYAERKYFPTPEFDVVPETIKDYDVVTQDNASTDETKIPTNTQSAYDMSPNSEVSSNSSSQPLSPQAEVHIPVPKDLLANFSSIRMSYVRMFYNVCKILEQKLEVADIKKFLFYYSSSLSKKVNKCSDISSILRHVKKECSLTDIELLHSIVEEMDITEAEEYIETYRKKLSEACKSLSISLCLNERFDSIPHLQCQTVTFIFDWKPKEHMLEDIKEILAKVSSKLLKIQFIEPSNSICELKEKDQDLLRHTEVISYIILEETEYILRDAISSKEKETNDLKQELSGVLSEEESLSVQSDTESIKEVKKEPLDKELTVLSSQFNEIKEENKELSDKLSGMKVDYLRSLSSNTDSAASKVRRGMALEIDDCKCCLEAMTRPDYQPLVDNKRIIEKLQEEITVANMELIAARKLNKKIIKDIEDFEDDEPEVEGDDSEVEDDDSEVEEIEYDSLSDEEDQLSSFLLYCNHPVTGELTSKLFQVHKDELLPTVLDTAYELMELAPHIPIERCRLVKYDIINDIMEQSFDLDKFQDQTIGQLMGVAGYCGLFLETCRDIETFKKYSTGDIYLKISVVDLFTGKVGPAKPIKSEEGWTVGELKQYIGELFNLNSSCMRVLLYNEAHSVIHLKDVERSLKNVLFKGDLFSSHKLHGEQLVVPTIYVSSDPIDFLEDYKDSLMHRYVDFHFNSILLDITLPPPQPEATHTTTNLPDGRLIMKTVSINEEDKRKIQVQVDKRITLAELKEELVPLIGVPPAGFRVYGIRYNNEEYEMEGLDETLMNIISGSKVLIHFSFLLYIV